MTIVKTPRPVQHTGIVEHTGIVNVGGGGALDYLFGDNYVGDYWDFLTFDKLYQDSTKTTPVTSAGDPVGACVGELGTDQIETNASLKPTAQDGYIDFTSGGTRRLQIQAGRGSSGTLYGYTFAGRFWQTTSGAFVENHFLQELDAVFGSNDFIAMLSPNSNAVSTRIMMNTVRSVGGVLYNSTPRTYIINVQHDGSSVVASWLSVDGGAKQSFTGNPAGAFAFTNLRPNWGITSSTQHIRSSRMMHRYTIGAAGAVDLSADDITNIHNWLTAA